MPVKQGVLEPVLEAAQTPVTGPIALPRTSLKELNSVLEHGSTVLFNSLTASRTLLGNPTAADIIRNVQGMDVSDDEKWIAVMLYMSRSAWRER